MDDTIEERIDLNIKKLQGDTRILWEKSEIELNKVFNDMDRQLRRAGKRFADDKLTRINIADLIKDMVMDHFDNGNRADRWFAANMSSYLEPVIKRYQAQVNNHLNQFNNDFSNRIDQFNRMVYADLEEAGVTSSSNIGMNEVRAITDRVLTEKGFATGLNISGKTSLAVAGVATSYSYRRIMQMVTLRLRTAAMRILSPVVAKTVVRLGTGAALSWIPIAGAVVTAGGTIWTIHDVVKMSDDTQEAFMQGLEEVIVEMREDLDANLRKPISVALKQLQQSDEEIKSSLLALRR